MQTVGEGTAWLPAFTCTWKTYVACLCYTIIIGASPPPAPAPTPPNPSRAPRPRRDRGVVTAPWLSRDRTVAEP